MTTPEDAVRQELTELGFKNLNRNSTWEEALYQVAVSLRTEVERITRELAEARADLHDFQESASTRLDAGLTWAARAEAAERAKAEMLDTIRAEIEVFRVATDRMEKAIWYGLIPFAIMNGASEVKGCVPDARDAISLYTNALSDLLSKLEGA